jgi:hypothetical protein
MSELAGDLSLKTLISAISDELLASQAERAAAGRPALFEVNEVTLEVSFVITNSKSGGGGFTFHVLKAEGSVKYDTQSVQKATLKLAALKTTPLPGGGFGPIRPQIAGDDRP